ncbi:uncharacterized protein N7477_004196 [Penicillium maclennaniae]|uniref:uncharacterized protein n=1 Tax=Penicillium maclennaniae TaxID=1343394 RepID=UPI00254133C4|nr:uncharacterized protein N7477_004196 [Penicillium maclennaniae]KAJ5678563.1 hypothetical protein N7477_004196 [Penicillium maclennaniae]
MTPKRSARACSGCRLRKVRCDVTKRGFPCTNCQSYHMPCTIPVDRRGKLATAAEKEKVGATTPSDNELLTESQLGGCMNRTPDYWNHVDVIASDALDDTRPLEDGTINWRLLLPEYARPLSLAITREDCSVLLQKGAFDIPEARIRDELLRSYIQFVHPALPILNLENFLMVIDTSYTGGMGISFLLFQAVIFAATTFESEESLAREGFQNQREARKTRFDRVRMLYSFGCEDDRVTVLQTLLLMTYWDNKSDDLHDAWYFVGEATKIWRSIKTEPKSLEAELKRQKPELWKRISWSLYIRDRLVAIYTRQPFHINEADFRTPLLNLSDFEVGPLSTECCLGSDGSHPAIRDPSMHRLLAQISIALALKQLGETYPSADQALASVDAAVMKRKSPVQSTRMASTFPFDTEELGHNEQAVVDLQPTDGSERVMEPNIQQEIAHMSSQRMGELLCSHFMMTPSERSMLQGLVMPEVDNSEFYSD